MAHLKMILLLNILVILSGIFCDPETIREDMDYYLMREELANFLNQVSKAKSAISTFYITRGVSIVNDFLIIKCLNMISAKG